MSNQTITQVRERLLATLPNVTTGTGYNNDVLSNNIYPIYSPKFLAQKEDKYFPKLFVVTYAGETQNLTSQRQEKRLAFNIIVVVKAISESDDPQAMIESYIEDIEKLLRNDSTLGGVVQDAQVRGFTTDSGQTFPEGTAVIRVETDRYVT